MKRYLVTVALATTFAIGAANAQTQKANPVDGSGNPQGAQTLDPAGTKAMKKDNMVKGAGSTMQRSGASSDPVEGSGSAQNDKKLDPSGAKAAQEDAAKGRMTTGRAPAPAKATGIESTSPTGAKSGGGTGPGGSGGSGNGR